MVIVNRGPLLSNNFTDKLEFNQKSCFQGRAIDRVYPGGMFEVSTFPARLACLSYFCSTFFPRCNRGSETNAWRVLSGF